MKKSELIKTNAILQESLTKENEKYYSNLIVYIRVMAFFRDERKSEELLLEVLKDILDAQEQGLSAEEYFGKNPKKIADEIINQLPINLFDTIKILLIGMGAYLISTILPALIFPDNGLDIGRIFISGIYWTILVVFSLWLLGISLYQFKNTRSKIFYGLLLGLGVTVGVMVNMFVSTPIKIDLSGRVGIVTIVLVTGILLLIFFNQEDKKVWIPFVPIVVTSAVLGILTRIEFFSTLLISKEGKIGIAVILGILLLIQYVLIFKSSKK
ncbi:hypothetical protein LZ578_11425 [Jeotgalibaca sp. MA1X17-3]|uniref:hypothetical protein n=1 Tax=Jeotgalibaca sp. MA1X17-3 TaxID=2908211 RepID=UPI001F358C97|nr:hypothetical protein [Jeotgalibaca sp. MA1X17-3]UJF15555.1 hypothetical protein LZ578_11425 [Jeotgalibaca sp. MA1X17-3]